MDAKKIGGYIKKYRKEKGLSQRELAEKLFVSDKTISRWELGNGLPDIAMLPIIAELLGISLDEFIGNGTETVVEVVADIAETESGRKKRLKPRLLAILSCLLVLALVASACTVYFVAFHSRVENTYIFEAEEALFSEHYEVEQVAHASGGQVAAWLHTPGETITFKVQSDRVADVQLGIVINRPTPFIFENKLTLEVNGQPVTVGNVLGLGWHSGMAEDVYYYSFGEPVELNVSLRKGENFIVFTIVDGEALNFDCIRITSTARIKSGVRRYNYEAENADIEGLCSVIESKKASGGRYVSDLGSSEKKKINILTFHVLPEHAAYVMLYIAVNRPFNYTFETRFLLEVNGEPVTVGKQWDDSIDTPDTDDRQTYFSDPYVVGIYLQDGDNQIRFTSVYGDNFDCIWFYTSLKMC